MRISIASWNINSVRARIGIVEKFLREEAPDILCLQETKVECGLFPPEMFRRLGYEHIVTNGQRMHHGVAIVSRLPMTDVRKYDWQANGEARHIGVTLPSGVRLDNVYIPAGGDIPDPGANPKFVHKLSFLDEMRDSADVHVKGKDRAILLGDLNVAPREHDVWSHKQLLDVVSHTPIECEKLTAACKSGGWVDVMRELVPEPTKLYTWWSYRSPDWKSADKGRRLDHIWLSPAIADRVSKLKIAKEARGWGQPSDHVPVTAILEV